MGTFRVGMMLQISRGNSPIMYVYVIRCVIKRIFSSTFLGLSNHIPIHGSYQKQNDMSILVLGATGKMSRDRPKSPILIEL